MRGFRKLAAWLLGGILFAAGFLKLMDPVGAGLVMEEYMKFFHLGFMRWMAGPAGIGMALFETVLGAAVITGVWRKTVAIISGAVMGLFTLTTLVLLIWNPDMNCGCFGEAIPLTHAQSFLKNIILDLLWVISYVPFRKMQPVPEIKYTSFCISCVSVVLFMFWSLRNIPPVDFTDMKTGTELYSDAEDFTWEDAPVLSICDADGQYADSLLFNGRVFVVSYYNSERISAKDWKKNAEFAAAADSLGMNTLVLLPAIPEEEVPSLLDGKIYSCDRRALMTLNRANGGITFICQGQISMKWKAGRYPQGKELQDLAIKDSNKIVLEGTSGRKLKLQAFLLYVYAVMLLI